ncbi:ABC transporter permease [Vulgatibacter incomptus]|uniref:Gliding motility protein GldF n=1 Tax=Vulgatibacter incomptus TaxID=1391653 RepID=A0A0K1PCZ3_9BACT|nr:ABC transporter permease [Vulgatibacter incomptus]AKU91372.1 gliding motility protein GldF [Vulgatibacter incomptus]
MRNAIAIAKKELYLYFTTPIAYVAFFATSFIGAWFFLSLTSAFQRQSMQFMQFQAQQMLERMNLTDMVAAPLLVNMGLILTFVIPFLSMRLFSEERRQKTMELLMTAPVRSAEIVGGKFLASLVVLAVVIAIVAAFPALLSVFGSSSSGSAVEWQTIGAGLTGLFLCGAAFLAIGLFVSSLTDSQVVAALITFFVLLLSWMVSWKASEAEGAWREVILHASSVTHLVSFARGIVDLKDVVYFLSVIVLGLFLTHRAVESRRWS